MKKSRFTLGMKMGAIWMLQEGQEEDGAVPGTPGAGSGWQNADGTGASSLLSSAANCLEKGNKEIPENGQSLLEVARFRKDRVSAKPAVKKTVVQTGEVCCSSPVLSAYAHESDESAFSRYGLYRYDLNADYFYKECAGYNFSALVEKSNNLMCQAR